MHSGCRRQWFLRAGPERWIVEPVRIYGREFIFTRILADDLARRIDDLERDGTTRVSAQIEIYHRAGGRIVGPRFIARLRGSVVTAGNDLNGIGWLKQNRVFARHRGRQLSERADVVEHPETAAMRGHDQIVV